MTGPDSPLLISTLVPSSAPASRARARVACLTIACHPDPRRIGERALLTPLLVRQTVQLSRIEPLFAHPGHEGRRPLADPYLSRSAIRISRTLDGAGAAVCLDGLPAHAELDGLPAGPICSLPEAALDSGVLLQLSSRVLLLLHATSAEAPLEIDGILGASDTIDRVRRQVAQVAELDTPVLIRGESGSGKERVAKALHARGKRSQRRLVAVNMATLGESTAPAALFGYARGSFTGAAARHRGYFEQADGGTLFLDEVGDTPQSVQPMLLRALETGLIQPLGDEHERAVNVRLIAATESDLEHGTQSGAFRVALKHRLSGYEIAVPALRERRDDIPRLFVHFLRAELRALDRETIFDSDESNPDPPLHAAVVARLTRHAFPGNVRELINLARQIAIESVDTGSLDASTAIECACVVEETKPAVGTAPQAAAAGPDPSPPLDEAALLDALERHDFSPMRAAAELGVPSGTLHFWMRRARIRRAADLDAAEIVEAQRACGGDLLAMAKRLRVSSRGLKLALGRRGHNGASDD